MCRLRNIAICDYQESVTTGQTDRHTDRWTDRRRTKLSLCACMLRRRQKMTFDLDLWPTDLNINRDHLLIKDCIPIKFELVGHRVIICTRWRRLTWISIGIMWLRFRSCWNILSKLDLAPVNFRNRTFMAIKLIQYTYIFKWCYIMRYHSNL